MAVELCKVSLWMEALEPGRPLSFLDHRIVLGNSLLGTTPELVAAGVPADAFKPILGDDKQTVSALRKHNAKELLGQLALEMTAARAEADVHALAEQSASIASIDDGSIAGVREQQERFEQLLGSEVLRRASLAADVWCAAFVADKRPGDDPITQDTLVRVLRDARTLSPGEVASVQRARETYSFLHWHVAFPHVWDLGGFDVVLANPPWERVKLQEKEFFAARSPEIATAANKAARERLIKRLVDDDPALLAAFEAAKREAEGASHFIRSSGRYPLCGRGDVNTYAVFAELIRSLAGRRGRAGVIVPTGIATDDTTKHFFGDLVNARSLVSLYSFENEEFIFPEVHHATKFCLLTMSGPPLAPDPEFVFFARRTQDLADEWRRFSLSADDIARVNPNTGTAPVFRGRRDAEVTRKIYERVPPLVREGTSNGNPWNVQFIRMFDMSNDSGVFEGEPGDDRLPLYEGKMFWQFDHRYGTYEGQTDAQANQGTLPPVGDAQHRDPRYVVQPRYWLARSAVEQQVADRDLAGWFIAVRGISSPVVNRTLIASALPLAAVGNSAPVIGMRNVEVLEKLALLACANSFATDYTCRQKAGGVNLNFFILKQIAIPSPAMLRHRCAWSATATYLDFLVSRCLELVYTAHDLDAIREDDPELPGPFLWEPERRWLIRAELDAAVFHLYGVDRIDVDHIMSTFPVAESYEQRDLGEFRTKRLILERYDAMGTAAASGHEYMTPLDPPPGDRRAAATS